MVADLPWQGSRVARSLRLRGIAAQGEPPHRAVSVHCRRRVGGGGGARRHGDQNRRALRQPLLPDLPDRRRQDPRDQGVSGFYALRARTRGFSGRAQARGRLKLPLGGGGFRVTWLRYNGDCQTGGKAMSKGIFNPPTMMKPAGYSHVAKVTGGALVYIAGQVSADPSGNLVGEGNLEAQAEQVFKNLKAAVEAAGGAMSDLIKMNVYLVAEVGAD